MDIPNNMSNKFSLDLTIIIITHERPIHFKRTLKYIQNQPLNYIVLDSSKESPSLSIPENVIYNHYPAVSMIEKLNKGISQVKSKYVQLCADDDFLITDALRSLTHFLDQNNSYSAASGHTLSFIKKKNDVIFSSMYSYSRNLDINSDSIKERLTDNFSPYFPLFYGVHRVKNLIHAFNVSKKTIKENYNLTELAINFCATANGKWKVLPELFHIREEIIDSAGTYTDGLAIIYKNDYLLFQSFVNELSEYLNHSHSIDINDAKLFSFDALSTYISWGEKGIYPVKRRLALLFKTLYSIYKRINRTKIDNYKKSTQINLSEIKNLILEFNKEDTK